ncbi:PadR family transcriptional regulator [Actinomadura sp. ATCC 31491]|uniref:PadR family transcriptional regulator n=1 Tax=Actinomadura luzonensis TaxID=2805427 RepID=A0ABT0FJS8_9ACTN|nr:PadR family transcriptional regulator [Actinomadura luzonensis]MCK2212561.1 PadR family transcriptional regulator [Actinomadura luzonensis]
MSLRIALLGLLSAVGPASGYDLAKKFDRSLNHVWQAGHTQIYPELVKMAADGLVDAGSEGARGRKTYTITPEGARQLHEWMLEHTPSVVVRNEVALQAFLLPLLDRDDAIAVVERIRAGLEARLATLQCQQAGAFGSYALKLGLAQLRTSIGWTEETLADLRRAAG